MNMKTRKNIFNVLLTCFVATALWSCDDEVEYTPAEQSPVAETQVYFLDNESSELILTKDATSFIVRVGRTNSGSAQSIPLTVTNPNDSVFTSVPATAEFAAGETETEVTIQLGEKMQYFKGYYLKLAVPAEYVNPYIEQENHPELILNVSKEDYVPYAVGEYYSWWHDATYEQVMEYSEYLNRYRFANLWADGYDVEFTWDGTTITCLNTTVQSGYVDSYYGMVSATIQATKYYPEYNVFLFQYKWTVSAGSFGSGVDQYTITELK